MRRQNKRIVAWVMVMIFLMSPVVPAMAQGRTALERKMNTRFQSGLQQFVHPAPAAQGHVARSHALATRVAHAQIRHPYVSKKVRTAEEEEGARSPRFTKAWHRSRIYHTPPFRIARATPTERAEYFHRPYTRAARIYPSPWRSRGTYGHSTSASYAAYRPATKRQIHYSHDRLASRAHVYCPRTVRVIYYVEQPDTYNAQVVQPQPQYYERSNGFDESTTTVESVSWGDCSY